jgi:hypothetical protein
MRNLNRKIYNASMKILMPSLTQVKDAAAHSIIMKFLVLRKTSCLDDSKTYLKHFEMNHTYYKIVQHTKDEFKTLFHGIKGSKVLDTNVWINAVIKHNVSDGKGSTYTSGIHIIDGYENAVKYMNRFKRTDITIVECRAKGIRHKAKSKPYVYLADSICIIEK